MTLRSACALKYLAQVPFRPAIARQVFPTNDEYVAWLLGPGEGAWRDPSAPARKLLRV
jgi:hypothetical protein